MALFPLLLFICFHGTINAQGYQNMTLTLFPPNTQGAQCLDGSPAGFYHQPPQHGDSNLWVIFLQGGGACGSLQTCEKRANGPLGSSKYWSKQYNLTKDRGLCSSDPTINPDFYQGHHVFAPYCSGDVWAGQRATPSKHDPDTWGFYFSGHLIFESIINYLGEHFNLLNASHVLLSGTSAGGIGTFCNIDFLSDQIKNSAVNKSVMVKGAPVSGWFWPTNTSDQLNNPLMPPNDYPHWIANKNGGVGHQPGGQLYDSYMYPTCVNALSKTNNSWQCQSVGNAYKYIKTPIFVMQDKFDKNQITSGFLMPANVSNSTKGFVAYFGGDSDRSILSQMVESGQTRDGLFYPSCFAHVTGLGAANGKNLTVIDGKYNSSELVGDWFWERNKLPHIVYDTCNSVENQLPCNPAQNCAYPPLSD